MHQPTNNNTYTNIELVLKISLIHIIIVGIIIGSSDKISFLVLGFHTNSTRDSGIAGIGTPNMEGLQPAIEAQEHINAASQALKNGNNSEVSLQLQLANQMLFQFIGGGVGNATAENTTAPPTGNTGTNFPAGQTDQTKK
jgi:ABC-type tungstate transport system permease subunit